MRIVYAFCVCFPLFILAVCAHAITNTFYTIVFNKGYCKLRHCYTIAYSVG